MKEHYYGLNCTVIPTDVILSDLGTLEDLDRIANQDGNELMYREPWHGFVIVTPDPSVFLSDSQIYQKWKKI